MINKHNKRRISTNILMWLSKNNPKMLNIAIALIPLIKMRRMSTKYKNDCLPSFYFIYDYF